MKKKLITKITTECRLSSQGLWIYSAKIYYQNKAIKSIQAVTAPSYDLLLENVKEIGKNLIKKQNQ